MSLPYHLYACIWNFEDVNNFQWPLRCWSVLQRSYINVTNGSTSNHASQDQCQLISLDFASKWKCMGSVHWANVLVDELMTFPSPKFCSESFNPRKRLLNLGMSPFYSPSSHGFIFSHFFYWSAKPIPDWLNEKWWWTIPFSKFLSKQQ